MELKFDPELKDWLSKQTQSSAAKKTTTTSPSKHRKRNRFPMGKTGYIPQSAGQNPYKMRK